MITRGEYRDQNGTYGAIIKHTKLETEVILVESGVVHSAFKTNKTGDYSFLNKKAKEAYTFVRNGIKGCTAKNGMAAPFVFGTSVRHEFTKSKVEYSVELYNNEMVGAQITSDNSYVYLEYFDDPTVIPSNIPYIKLTPSQVDMVIAENDADTVIVRTIEEIALEKDDITWLNNKKYYIVNDDEQAEKIFEYLDNYNGVIAYDTETTGLRINCFGKINSDYQRELIRWNEENPDNQLRADKLVGIIFCIENDVSYYFPCFNRRFDNLYQNPESDVRKKIVQKIKADYTVGELHTKNGDMAEFIRNTPTDDWSSDIILMERVRKILETKHLVAHNGSFEWKCGWMYDIDTNIKDDTMILHQIMYKFRTTTSNRGEPSNLKYLAKVELGIDQWELKDFFPDFKEDKGGAVRNKGKNKVTNTIDFSYMDYDGTRIYAPTDGDVTYQLFMKYKHDLVKNHREQEYIYNVEVIVAAALGYMEFYGHRLDEDKIYAVRDKTRAEIVLLESEIRQYINYSKADEIDAFNELKTVIEESKEHEDNDELIKEFNIKILNLTKNLEEKIKANTDDVLNLASPAQVSDLFYNRLEIPYSGEKMSVAKKVIKSLLKAKDDEGNNKYPIVHLYSEYKNKDTLMTKFFDNLPYYMYPGGIVFSSFGQISTATGRMSCSKPNAQQYPSAVTALVSPRKNHVLASADYSQIEYRVLVALSGEEFLAELFKDPDNDYHTLMASLMYGVPYASVTPKMRGDAKSFNFGIPYGMGLGNLAIKLTGVNNVSTREEAAEKYELYFKDQPKVRKFFNDVKEMASVNKYTKTFWNRYRYYSFSDKDGKESDERKAMSLRQAGNAIIQGCLDGDTRIQTKEFGIVKIKDVVNKHLMVWDGDKWSNGDILYSGKKKKCTIKFSNGQSIVCSPIHKFLVVSHRGKKRFVECKDLLSKENSKNAHRVVINKKYAQSDYKYSSENAYKYTSTSNNSNNVFLEDIKNSFDIGVVLGRLASDGSVLPRDVGASSILHYIAESEYTIAEELKKCMSAFDVKEYNGELREGRNEAMTRLAVYSKSLTSEVVDLDIKHKVHDNIFMDTEVLRGFLRGMFDGDGGISGKTITLTFGKQHNFESMCKDIQKALLFFGIRSRYYDYEDRYKIIIKTNDNQRFLDIIGFINENKQNKGRELVCDTDEHIFGPSLVVESVEITDEYIDMYDVCNTDDGYYVADGIITHNTAADIFKIAVARNWMFIKNNNLIGKLHIVNLIHDEILFEINIKELNARKIVSEIGKNMGFNVDGFPPLFIGAGIGMTWNQAKGKMAEIHPWLLEQFKQEEMGTSIYNESDDVKQSKEIIEYFNDRVFEFRKKQVMDYVTNSDNFGKDLHPAIGNLLNLQFTFGHNKSKEGISDTDFTLLCLEEFISHYNIDGVEANMFTVIEQDKDIEEDKEYDDEDDDMDFEDSDGLESNFALIDESDVVFGTDIHQIIETFGSVVAPHLKVCGLDTRGLNYKQKDIITDFLMEHLCEPSDNGAMQIVFLNESKVLNATGLWVNNINGSDVEARIKIAQLG